MTETQPREFARQFCRENGFPFDAITSRRRFEGVVDARRKLAAAMAKAGFDQHEASEVMMLKPETLSAAARMGGYAFKGQRAVVTSELPKEAKRSITQWVQAADAGARKVLLRFDPNDNNPIDKSVMKIAVELAKKGRIGIDVRWNDGRVQWTAVKVAK